jgi:hypothetical protein
MVHQEKEYGGVVLLYFLLSLQAFTIREYQKKAPPDDSGSAVLA